MATAAAAVMARARRDVAGAFLSADAVRPSEAIMFTAGSRLQQRAFERFKSSGVVKSQGSRWYLDPVAYHNDTNRRRRAGLIVVGIAAAASAVLALL